MGSTQDCKIVVVVVDKLDFDLKSVRGEGIWLLLC